jgi:hypothetical protein
VTADQEVMIITINRPAAKNAITMAVAQGIAAALDELDARDDLAVGVITCSGGTFCAGMDLKCFIDGQLPCVDGRGFAGIAESSASKPLIAAVEGYALAGGFEIALACDLITAGAGARFGIPEVKRGLVAAAGGLMRLPDRIPPNVAMELAPHRELPRRRPGSRARPGEPSGRQRRRADGSPRPCQDDQRERPARRALKQEDHDGIPGMAGRTEVDQAAIDRRLGLRFRRRQGGGACLYGEARTKVEEQMNPSPAASAEQRRMRAGHPAASRGAREST